MIHAQIDTVDHRQIIHIEYGNRVKFDARHGGDPLWVFLDSYRVLYRVNFAHFQLHPGKYKINAFGDLVLTDDLPIIPVIENPIVPIGYKVLHGRDGRNLLGADNRYLLGTDGDYVLPPPGYVYILDDDSTILKDPDGAWLIELEGDATFVNILTDADGNVLSEDDGSTALSDQ